MMKKFFAWGNDLHSGRTSIPFIKRSKLWLGIAVALMIASLIVPLLGGFNLGIAFKGGSQFQIANTSDTSEQHAHDAVAEVVGNGVSTTVVSPTRRRPVTSWSK